MCRIGEHAFYFCDGDVQAEGWSKYLHDTTIEDRVTAIHDALVDLKHDGFTDEFAYYESILSQN